MALYSQTMLEIAIELAAHDRAYQDLAANFVVHFALIAHAMNEIGPDGMWDEEDGVYYDILADPMGSQPSSRSARWWASYRSAPQRS